MFSDAIFHIRHGSAEGGVGGRGELVALVPSKENEGGLFPSEKKRQVLQAESGLLRLRAIVTNASDEPVILIGDSKERTKLLVQSAKKNQKYESHRKL
jgi:hypothetical protein